MSTNNELIYRQPDLFEIESIQKLFDNVLNTSFQMFSQEAISAHKKNWMDKIVDRIQHKSDLLLIAWDHETPIGLISGNLPEAGIGTIIWLLVEETYRNKKVGNKLFTLGCQYYKYKNCHKIKLTAPSERAKNFYVKYGMQVEGFHPQHWWKADYWALGLNLEFVPNYA